MGGEIGQWGEWNHDRSLDWHLLEYAPHQGIKRLVSDLNRLYRTIPALHECDADPSGFEWVDCNDTEQSVIIMLRRGHNRDEAVLLAFNFTPVPRHNYRVGVPWEGFWEECVNTDAPIYGGSGQGNFGGLDTAPVSWHGQPQSLNLVLPPLAMVAFHGRRDRNANGAPAGKAPGRRRRSG
jgi:1,4-alpha-glucan branching enzyme